MGKSLLWVGHRVMHHTYWTREKNIRGLLFFFGSFGDLFDIFFFIGGLLMEPGRKGGGHWTGLEGGNITSTLYIHERHDGMEMGEGRKGTCFELG